MDSRLVDWMGVGKSLEVEWGQKAAGGVPGKTCGRNDDQVIVRWAVDARRYRQTTLVAEVARFRRGGGWHAWTRRTLR